MQTNDRPFPPELEAKIVRCVEEAVGNDIQADIRNAGLVGTPNSMPTRIWDLLNRNLIRTIDARECTIAEAHTGPWHMLVLYEPSSRNVITLMREKRFVDIRRYQRRRRRMHYLDALTKQFNSNLLAEQEQLSLIPHVFTNEDELAEIVQNLLRGLGGECETVQNHVLILFDTIGDQLVHIRAIKITPNLDIAQEWDLSQYISGATNAVVEKVDQINVPENQPNRGLSLKGKALERKEKKIHCEKAAQELLGES